MVYVFTEIMEYGSKITGWVTRPAIGSYIAPEMWSIILPLKLGNINSYTVIKYINIFIVIYILFYIYIIFYIYYIYRFIERLELATETPSSLCYQ